MTISAVITTYNRAEQLFRCLWSMCELGRIKPDEVCIVDDGSIDHTPQLFYRLPALFRCPFKLRRIERAPGWRNPAVPRNVAIRMTREDADLLWFLEPEMLLPAETLAKLVSHFSGNGDWHKFVNAGLQGFIGRPLHDDEWRNPMAVWSKPWVERRSGQIALRCALVPREAVFKVRGYDAWFSGGVPDEEGRISYGGPGHDDTDFVTRLQMAGYRMVLDDKIPVLHQWHTSGLWSVRDIDEVNIPHMQMHQRLGRYQVNDENWGLL